MRYWARRSPRIRDIFSSASPLRRHDGELRSFLTRVTPIRDADGKIVRWVGVNTDVEDIPAAHALRDEMREHRVATLQLLLSMRAAKEKAEGPAPTVHRLLQRHLERLPALHAAPPFGLDAGEHFRFVHRPPSPTAAFE